MIMLVKALILSRLECCCMLASPINAEISEVENFQGTFTACTDCQKSKRLAVENTDYYLDCKGEIYIIIYTWKILSVALQSSLRIYICWHDGHAKVQ